jgi:hypothetical protein
MRIEGEGGSINLIAGTETDGYAVSAVMGCFSGANPRVYIEADGLQRFVADLELLERKRQGEARLSAMSPGIFELAIQIIDPLGHSSAKAVIGSGRYEGRRYLTSKLAIEFEIDPTSLPILVQQAKELLI